MRTAAIKRLPTAASLVFAPEISFLLDYRHTKWFPVAAHSCAPSGYSRITPTLVPYAQYWHMSVFLPPITSIATDSSFPTCGVVHHGSGSLVVISVRTVGTGQFTSC